MLYEDTKVILCARESPDDGILTGLLMPPLIATALLHTSLGQPNSTSSSSLPSSWLIEPPPRLSSQFTPLQALIIARYSLVNLATFCSTILFCNVLASWLFEARFSHSARCGGEVGSVPRSKVKRALLYVFFTICVTTASLCVKYWFNQAEILIWQR